ncbi:MAG: M1 family metallopeptidase [Melioribacteraceae bacterium]|nr:M1 family metallopeptidase [Melioribacteraceae bacterium]MCF8355825.1 M1 family metallopeptidase [Melioribacteraceae bacterium]MCF8395282.1 M1 family metallopeptidase [Melioribacteraceae bacterium]MCF8420731.1 M1 family metallopeptidase [Melioribacteraceae bacterium]
MKQSVIFQLIIALFVAFSLFAQSTNIYIPLDIQEAYKNGTRSYDGKPGINYWQNSADYKIKAELLPDTSMLKGDAEIKYYNNSPDSLKIIVMRLYQDLPKKGASRDWYIGTWELTDGVDVKYITVNDDSLSLDQGREVLRGSTNMTLRLAEPLPPGSSTNIKIGWEFNIPKILRLRMGNYEDGEFFISYWYPQIAVYDDIDGWDRVEYQGSVEFYNDMNNYDVELTVPGGYIIWATGVLQNAEAVLSPKIYKRYEKAKETDDVMNIVSVKDWEAGEVVAGNEKNTFHFKADNVPDFSFAVSNSYVWDAASLVVDSLTGRRSVVNAVYEDSTVNYNEAAKFSRITLEYMSNELPGYPYPYPHVTSFSNKQRGGGMETPMMANDGAPVERASHIGLIFHEIAHNYFPFFMGINERKYAWMDEGWAAFYPAEVVEEHEPDWNYQSKRVASYEESAGEETELPPIVLSYSYNTSNARTGFYNRPAIAYKELEKLLGRDLFKKSIIEYIERWQGKHPLPYDFFLTVNDVAGEDLSWFWNPWFAEFGYPDLSIKSVDKIGDKVDVVVKKIGNIPTEVIVTAYFKDGTTSTKQLKSSIWKNGVKEVTVSVDNKGNLEKVVIGNNLTPDAVDGNNEFVLE